MDDHNADRQKMRALREAHEWRFRINAPDFTPAVERAFEEWRASSPLHAEMFERAQSDYDALGELSKSDIDFDLLQPIHVERKTDAGRAARRTFWAIGSVWKPAAFSFAAVVIAGIVSMALLPPTSTVEMEPQSVVSEYRTAAGEIETIVLEDGTEVTLSAASSIATEFSETQRTVFLEEGAAFFDVVNDPDRPFIVDAGPLDTRVLGTSFEVIRTSELVRVSVAEGLVEVSHPFVLDDQMSSLRTLKKLSAGDSVSASQYEGLSSIKPVNQDAIGAWRQGKLFYDGARLSELISDANRYTEKHVFIAEGSEMIADYRVRGAFNASDIDGMLSTLSDIYPVFIDRSDAGSVRISARQ
ncbi:MAG: FecR domain-containing protein [Pseudomonadota bacterium]